MSSPVWSTNEWDPLELVVVGRLEGAQISEWNFINGLTIQPGEYPLYDALRANLGQPYPPEMVRAAQAELDGLIATLQAHGATALRPDPPNFAQPIGGYGWKVGNGFSVANPRDVIIVAGDEMIEVPMADRSRYHELFPYRRILKQMFDEGARWSAAPKPTLADSFFDADWTPETFRQRGRFCIGEDEPTFDAADFIRCGEDIFGQQSHVTNAAGIAWLRRHLAPRFRVHELFNTSPYAIHIDTTFIPVGPKRAIVNPVYLDRSRLPAVLHDWELLPGPEPVDTGGRTLGIVSRWINMNMLQIDPEHIICEEKQETTIRALKGWGFTPIPLPFENYYPFAGSFHCATLDLRRARV